MAFGKVLALALVLITVAVELSDGRMYGSWDSDQHPDKWNKSARDRLDLLLNRKANLNVAKNLILFLGDGMGISTVSAGRIRKGQFKNKSGEEEVTNMESLDHVALSKVSSGTRLVSEGFDGFNYKLLLNQDL